MSIIIKSTEINYKDPDTGNYIGVNVVADKKTSEQLKLIEKQGQDVRDSLIGADFSTVSQDIFSLRNFKKTMTLEFSAVSEFSSSTVYHYGDYTKGPNNNRTYKYISEEASSGDWDSSKWESNTTYPYMSIDTGYLLKSGQKYYIKLVSKSNPYASERFYVTYGTSAVPDYYKGIYRVGQIIEFTPSQENISLQISNNNGGVHGEVQFEIWSEIEQQVIQNTDELKGRVKILCTGASNKNIDTYYPVKSGKKYYVKIDSASSSLDGYRFNIILSPGSGVSFALYDSTIGYARCTTDGYLRIYNYSEFIGEVVFHIWSPNEEIDPEFDIPDVYHIGPNGDYTTFTQFCCHFYKEKETDVRDPRRPLFDRNEHEKKIVYISPGEYDLYAEYRTAISNGWLYPVPNDGDPNYNSSNMYEDYNVNVPDNVKIIGIGDVIFKWDPPDSPYTQYNSNYTYRIGDFVKEPFNDQGTIYICNTSIDTPEEWNPEHWSIATQSQIDNGNFLSYNEAHTLSPINVIGNFEMENITIIMSNGRYIVHDDPHNNPIGTRHIYRNCRFIRIRHRDGKWICNGNGYVENGYYKYENCYFENTSGVSTSTLTYLIGGHEGNASTTTKISTSPHVIFDSCVLKTIGKTAMRFTTINKNGVDLEKIYVDLNNCYITGTDRQIWFNQQYPSSDQPSWVSGQFFAVKLLNSGNPIFMTDIGSENNPYPPEVYPPIT